MLLDLIDPHLTRSRYYRPTEVDLLLGNPAKAQKKLGWKPKITFKVSFTFDMVLSECSVGTSEGHDQGRYGVAREGRQPLLNATIGTFASCSLHRLSYFCRFSPRVLTLELCERSNLIEFCTVLVC